MSTNLMAWVEGASFGLVPFALLLTVNRVRRVRGERGVR